MSTNLIIVSSLFCIFVIALIIFLTIKKRIKIKYAIIWILLFAILLLSIIIPGLMQWLTALLGFQTSSNMIICIIVSILVLISIATTAIISHQNKTIRNLVQEIAILNKKIKDLEN
ncbi:MAG: DUF2304 domain-containing protein [Coriobacteriia bacterium]|nr:DUF2304 domain-containing protein [Coriobacteriia bacterium]